MSYSAEEVGRTARQATTCHLSSLLAYWEDPRWLEGGQCDAYHTRRVIPIIGRVGSRIQETPCPPIFNWENVNTLQILIKILFNYTVRSDSVSSIYLDCLYRYSMVLLLWFCFYQIYGDNTKKATTHSWSVKNRFILSSPWLEDSRKNKQKHNTLLSSFWQEQNVAKPESCVTYKRGPGAHTSLHQAVFYNLWTSYLPFPFKKKPQACVRNAFKFFTTYCYLARRLHFFTRLKTTQSKQKYMNSLTLSIF